MPHASFGSSTTYVLEILSQRFWLWRSQNGMNSSTPSVKGIRKARDDVCDEASDPEHPRESDGLE